MFFEGPRGLGAEIVMDQHRVAIEFRSGIWLMFYETWVPSRCRYEQEFLRIVSRSEASEPAEVEAVQEKIDRKLYNPTIIRDDNRKNKRFRKA